MGIIEQVRTAHLRFLPPGYFLHVLRDTLFEWFELVRSPFEIRGDYQAFTNRSTALYLLRDKLNAIDLKSFNIALFQTQANKGGILRCFQTPGSLSTELTLFKPPSSHSSQICLAYVCKDYLGDVTEMFKCFLKNGVCTRKHITSDKELVESRDSLIEVAGNAVWLPPAYREELVLSLKNFTTKFATK
jgi:hypothetical protein